MTSFHPLFQANVAGRGDHVQSLHFRRLILLPIYVDLNELTEYLYSVSRENI